MFVLSSSDGLIDRPQVLLPLSSESSSAMRTDTTPPSRPKSACVDAAARRAARAERRDGEGIEVTVRDRPENQRY
jgi:hypothetical protein